MNPLRPSEPVVPFHAVPNSFIVKGLDASDQEKTHIFYADSEESRDRWVKLLNTRSQRFYDRHHSLTVVIDDTMEEEKDDEGSAIKLAMAASRRSTTFQDAEEIPSGFNLPESSQKEGSPKQAVIRRERRSVMTA